MTHDTHWWIWYYPSDPARIYLLDVQRLSQQQAYRSARELPRSIGAGPIKLARISRHPFLTIK